MSASIRDAENIIGQNIARIRKAKKIGQTELATQIQLRGVSMTRETLVKIEGGRQHIKLDQLQAIKTILEVEYAELLE